MYDGNNTATILTRTLSPGTVVAGDDVSYSGGTATFSDKNAANGKTVTGSGLALAGADAGNYTVNTTAATLADITPAALTVTANDASKPYGQTITLPTSTFTSTGLQNGDTIDSVNQTSPGTAAAATVAGNPYAITPGAAAGDTFNPANYAIDYVNGVLTVTPLPVPLGVAPGAVTQYPMPAIPPVPPASVPLDSVPDSIWPPALALAVTPAVWPSSVLRVVEAPVPAPVFVPEAPAPVPYVAPQRAPKPERN